MVCKEEIFLWFKSLKGSKRLEVLCGLLNMCCPLELRYCATCVEELASRDFYSLKEEEIKANNPNEISKIRNILDPNSRRKLIVALSLLHSSNVLCSNAMFKAFAEEFKVDVMISSGVFSDAKFVDEILLLLTLAQNHPAFTFDQQSYLMELCSAIENYQQAATEEENNRSNLSNVMPAMSLISPVLIQDSHICNNTSVCFHHRQYDPHAGSKVSENTISPNRILSLKAKTPHKKMSFRIRVTFGTNKMFDVFKTPYEIAVFHQKLAHLHSQDSQSANRDKFVPQLPHGVASCNKQEILNEGLTSSLTEYIEQLNAYLPSHNMQSDLVCNFFLPSGHGRNNLSKSSRNSDVAPVDDSLKNPRLRSLTIYNSHISECSQTKHLDGRPRIVPQSLSGQQHLAKLSENGTTDSAVMCHNSTLLSPVNSPYASPTNSETNSRSASPWVHRLNSDSSPVVPASESYTLEKLLMKENLHDYWEILRHFRIEELRSMTHEEFECLGLVKEASIRMKKMLDNQRTPNGISSRMMLRNSVPNNCLPIQDVSNESSPACSEYSSPSESPSPTDICNHNSSGTEDNSTDKGLPFKDHKLTESEERIMQETTIKRPIENLVFPKSNGDASTRPSASPVIPFPVGYATAIPQLSPMQSHKPSFLPMQCRTNAGLHIGASGVVFDGPFPRLPLQSALTFLPHMSAQRSHAGTPERGMPPAGLPITTLCPFPVVTSGCSTVPSATCSFAGNKSGNITVVTNSVASGNGGHNRQLHKVVQPLLDAEILPKPPLHQQSVDNIYATNCGYIFSSGDMSARPSVVSSCSCICTTTFPRPSSSPSPSLPPASTPQQSAVPSTLPYIGVPYVFPNSFPFIQAHAGATANGFIQPVTMPTAGQGFTYAFPNGMSALTPEMLYGAHAFSPQTPSPSQSTPPLIASAGSQCFTNYPHPVTVAGMTATHAVKIATCYNCGKMGHRGSECKDQNIEELTKPGKFQMNFVLAAKSMDGNE